LLATPHPFARFIRLLGRGKTLTRALTFAEAEEAMTMILAGEVLPEQLGAFLMLLRIKEETGEEIAGFIRAARAALPAATGAPVDLDWPSYAGKKRQLPWHLLATLRLAQAGWRVALHGFDGHTEGRVYAGETLARLGVTPAADFAQARAQLEQSRFTYLSLERIDPRLADMMALKPVLGLRSPVNSLVRALNPFHAATSMQAVFHPSYIAVHRDAAMRLDDARVCVFRGDGGENERRPNKACDTLEIVAGAMGETHWPPMSDPRQAPDESMDVERLGAVWRGASDDYGEGAVIGTIAIALHAMGAAPTAEAADARARGLWSERDRSRYLASLARSPQNR
jgi:anthranilate phosphoribosyltransferase